MAGVLVVVLGVLVFVAVRRPAPYDRYRVCHYVETTDPVTGRQVRIADPEFNSFDSRCVHSTARYPGHDWHSTPVAGVTGGTFGTSPEGEVFARDGEGRLVEVRDIGSYPYVTAVTWANGEPVPAVRSDAHITVFHSGNDSVHVLYESDGAGLVHVTRGAANVSYTAEILDPEPFPWRSAAMVERGDGYHVFWNSIRDDDRDRQRIMWAHGVATGGRNAPVEVRGPDTAQPVPGMRAEDRGAIAATTLGDTIHLFYADYRDGGGGLSRVSLGPGTLDWVGPYRWVPDDWHSRAGVVPPSLDRTTDNSRHLIDISPDSQLVASTVADPDAADGRPLVVVAAGTTGQGLLLAVYAQGASPTDLTLTGDLDSTLGTRFAKSRCLNEYRLREPRGEYGLLLETCFHPRHKTWENSGVATFGGVLWASERDAGLAVLLRGDRLYVAFGYSGAGIGLLVRERDWPVDWVFDSDFFLEHHWGDRVGTGWPVGLVPVGDTGIAIVAIPHEADPVTGEDRTKPLTITCTGCDA